MLPSCVYLIFILIFAFNYRGLCVCVCVHLSAVAHRGQNRLLGSLVVAGGCKTTFQSEVLLYM